ncbi:MAG: hypothetical protein PHP22_06685 [Oscillospiraceae bacterium]|jgi:TRAP-type C4-dicarboxylate transport system permease small subunit|nr:hypothetical protein [Oscillospiraceae bacterium]
MATWRKPTEEEAGIIIQNEKKRVTHTRIDFVILLLVVLFFVFIILVAYGISEIDKRAEEILGYPPRVTRNPAVGIYIDEDEKEARREEQEEEIEEAKALAAGEFHRKQLPVYLVLLSLCVGAYLICFFYTRNNLRDVTNQKYEVATGKFEDKSFYRVTRYWTQYFVVARFDDDTTEEGKATKEIFEEAKANQSILMVARPDQTGVMQVIRSYVLNPDSADADVKLRSDDEVL